MSKTELRWLRGLAVQREGRRGYQGSYTDWRRGIIKLPTLVGLVGEHALCLYLNKTLGLRLEVDVTDRPLGDGGVDLRPLGIPTQVKTRTRRLDVLLRRVTEDGRLLPLAWEICVSATWEMRDGYEPEVVTLDGWSKVSQVLDVSEFKRGYRGDWWNLEMGDECLEPMSDMVENLLAVRELKELR